MPLLSLLLLNFERLVVGIIAVGRLAILFAKQFGASFYVHLYYVLHTLQYVCTASLLFVSLITNFDENKILSYNGSSWFGQYKMK